MPDGLSVNAFGAECADVVVAQPCPVVQFPVPAEALSEKAVVGVPLNKLIVSRFRKPCGSEKVI